MNDAHDNAQADRAIMEKLGIPRLDDQAAPEADPEAEARKLATKARALRLTYERDQEKRWRRVVTTLAAAAEYAFLAGVEGGEFTRLASDAIDQAQYQSAGQEGLTARAQQLDALRDAERALAHALTGEYPAPEPVADESACECARVENPPSCFRCRHCGRTG